MKNNKKYIKHIIFPVIMFFALIIFSLTVKTNYGIILPGEVSNVNSEIYYNSNKEDNLYSVAVYYLHKPNALFRMILEISNKNDVFELGSKNSKLTSEEDHLIGLFYKKRSNEVAKYSALKEAKKIDFSINNKLYVDGFFIIENVKNLKIGYLITKVDEIQIKFDVEDPNNIEKLNEVYTKLINKNFNSLEYLYENKTHKVEGNQKVSFLLSYKNESNKTFNEPNLNNETGGPSAGLIHTLNLYLQLTNKRIKDNTKIAATGTIDALRLNKEIIVYLEKPYAGEIGGITQKVYTINKNKDIKYFLIPEGNRIEAQKAINQLLQNRNLNFKYEYVKTFEQALNFLLSNGLIE